MITTNEQADSTRTSITEDASDSELQGLLVWRLEELAQENGRLRLMLTMALAPEGSEPF